MILDRKTPPLVKEIADFTFPKPTNRQLSNGLPFQLVQAGSQEVCAVQLSFLQNPDLSFSQSFLMTKMLMEGTKKHTGEQISETFDALGASFGIDAGVDFVHIELYCLTKHLPLLLPMVVELLTEVHFTEKALSKQKNIQSQQLQINLEKNSFLASQIFRETLFGKDTFYGKRLRLEDLEKLTITDLEIAYQKTILAKPFALTFAGNVSQADIDLVNNFLGKLEIEGEFEKLQHENHFPESLPQKIYEEKENALQTSIRLGKRIFGQNHPDLVPYTVLNEIFGGYFGSRLMKNIREEKGLTYGIYSSYVAFRKAAYMVVATDIKKENRQQAIDEIYKEIQILQNQLIDPTELETVKSYMAGTFINSFSTPFAVADKYQAMFLRGLPEEYYNHFISNIKGVSAETIQALAQKYYKDFLELMVG